MASGQTHDFLCVVAGGVAATVVTAAGGDWVATAVAGLGGWAGLWLSPDLDLVSTPFKRWQKMGLGWVWSPYKDVIKHRSWISHIPVISTAIRLLWLGLRLGTVIAIALAALAVVQSMAFEGALDQYLVYLYVELANALQWTNIGQAAIAFFVGLSMADLFHWVADGCPVRI